MSSENSQEFFDNNSSNGENNQITDPLLNAFLEGDQRTFRTQGVLPTGRDSESRSDWSDSDKQEEEDTKKIIPPQAIVYQSQQTPAKINVKRSHHKKKIDPNVIPPPPHMIPPVSKKEKVIKVARVKQPDIKMPPGMGQMKPVFCSKDQNPPQKTQKHIKSHGIQMSSTITNSRNFTVYELQQQQNSSDPPQLKPRVPQRIQQPKPKCIQEKPQYTANQNLNSQEYVENDILRTSSLENEEFETPQPDLKEEILSKPPLKRNFSLIPKPSLLPQIPQQLPSKRPKLDSDSSHQVFQNQKVPQPMPPNLSSTVVYSPPPQVPQQPPNMHKAFAKPPPQPTPQQLSISQQRQKNLVDLSGKTFECIAQIEKMIDAKLKEDILGKFKKIVKGVLGQVATVLDKQDHITSQQTVEASTQAIQFIQHEVLKVQSMVSKLVEYQIPDGNDFQPMLTFQYKLYQIRDEVNLPIEDFFGQISSANFQSDSYVILNKNVYEFSICPNSSNRVILSQIFSLKSVPKFFLCHQGNLIFDSAIYIQSQDTQYLDKYDKQIDMTSVHSGAILNEECISLTHESISGQNFISIERLGESKYETLCYLRHGGDVVQQLCSLASDNELYLFGIQGKSIVRASLKDDPCTYNDQDLELETVFKNESPFKILDFQVFNKEYLAILTQCQEVVLIGSILTPNSQVLQRHQLPMDASRDKMMHISSSVISNPSIIVQDQNSNENGVEKPVIKLLDLTTGNTTIFKQTEEQSKENNSTIKLLNYLPHRTGNFDIEGYLIATQQKSTIYKESQLVTLQFVKQ